MKRNSRGFTLVEILIVVIILGILAAIVIPQFTNASSDARNNSVASTLQTMRGQIELFKIQHGDVPPASTAIWTVMMGKTNVLDTTQVVATGTLGPYCQSTPVNPINGKSNAADTTQAVATGTLGPYLQAFPINPLNGFSTVVNATGTAAGWVYAVSGGQYTIQATNTTGTAVLTY